MQHMSTHMLLSSLGADLDCHVLLPADGTRGGILIARKSMVYAALTSRIDTYSVSILFRNNNGLQWWLTGVYGPQQDDHKLLFLDELRSLRQACLGPWCIVGDFNMIDRAADKNNSNLDRAMMGRFRRLIND